MAAAAAEQVAAAAREPPPPPATAANARSPPPLDPRLLMAARRGGSGQLKDLLLLEDDEGQQAAGTTDTTSAVDMPAAAAEQVVLVQVDDHAPAAEPAPPPPSAAGGGGGGEQGTPDGTAAGTGTTSPLQVPACRWFPVPVPPPPPPLDGAALTMEGESLLHVVAGSCDCEESLRCAKMIAHDKKRKGGAAAMREALEATNRRDDTPLHCAAAAGNAGMVSCLVDLFAASVTADGGEDAAAVKKKEFLEAKNKCGETALHHAVRWASCTKMHNNRRAFWKKKRRACMVHHNNRGAVKDQWACIDNLMALDPELGSIDAKDGTSPLYLAISLGEMEIAEHLIAMAMAGQGKLSYSGPDGQNILHAAVSCGNRQALGMVLKWLKEPKTTADETGNNNRHETTTNTSSDLLIKQLTSQGDKKNGSTPLHLAASLWGFPKTGFTPGWHWVRSWRSAVTLLLDENVSTAFQADKEGLYPIHVAAATTSPSVVKTLLKRCPECAALRDARGRTFLHVAVEKNQILVVIYTCITSKLSWILNVQDNNGDTALHRAVHTGNLAVFVRLFWNPNVRLDVPNKDGMRPSDVSWSTMPLEAYYAWDPRMQIRNALLKVAAPYGETRGDLFDEKHAIINQEFRGGQGKISENLTSAAQVMGILSVLVTTVTFASAFTLPGGYRSAGDGGGVAGTPVLAGSYAFDAFLLADALAFICSLFATSLLLYAGVPTGTLRWRFIFVNRAYALMMNSGKSLVAAFGLGLYVALLPVARTIPIAIAVWMAMLAIVFITASGGIDSMFFTYPMFARRRGGHLAGAVLSWIVFVLDHFWCYMIIFGIPAIRKWARAR